MTTTVKKPPVFSVNDKSFALDVLVKTRGHILKSIESADEFTTLDKSKRETLLRRVEATSTSVLNVYCDEIVSNLNTLVSEDDQINDSKNAKEDHMRRSLTLHLGRKAKEQEDELRQKNAQVDFLKGLLLRREEQLGKQRQAFLKEIIYLREQLYQKDKYGDAYEAEMMSYWNWEGERPEGEIPQGESDGQKKVEQTIARLREQIEQLKAQHREELKQLELRRKEELTQVRRQAAADVESQLTALNSAESSQQQLVVGLNDKIATLQQEIDNHLAKIQELKERVHELETSNKELAEQLSSTEIEKQQLQKELSDSTKIDINGVEFDIETLKERFNALLQIESDYQALKAKFEALQEQNGRESVMDNRSESRGSGSTYPSSQQNIKKASQQNGFEVEELQKQIDNLIKSQAQMTTNINQILSAIYEQLAGGEGRPLPKIDPMDPASFTDIVGSILAAARQAQQRKKKVDVAVNTDGSLLPKIKTMGLVEISTSENNAFELKPSGESTPRSRLNTADAPASPGRRGTPRHRSPPKRERFEDTEKKPDSAFVDDKLDVVDRMALLVEESNKRINEQREKTRGLQQRKLEMVLAVSKAPLDPPIALHELRQSMVAMQENLHNRALKNAAVLNNLLNVDVQTPSPTSLITPRQLAETETTFEDYMKSLSSTDIFNRLAEGSMSIASTPPIPTPPPTRPTLSSAPSARMIRHKRIHSATSRSSSTTPIPQPASAPTIPKLPISQVSIEQRDGLHGWDQDTSSSVDEALRLSARSITPTAIQRQQLDGYATASTVAPFLTQRNSSPQHSSSGRYLQYQGFLTERPRSAASEAVVRIPLVRPTTSTSARDSTSNTPSYGTSNGFTDVLNSSGSHYPRFHALLNQKDRRNAAYNMIFKNNADLSASPASGNTTPRQRNSSKIH